MNNTSNIPADAVCVFADGNKVCAVRGDFVDIIESPAAFGDTVPGAIAALTGAPVGPTTFDEIARAVIESGRKLRHVDAIFVKREAFLSEGHVTFQWQVSVLGPARGPLVEPNHPIGQVRGGSEDNPFDMLKQAHAEMLEELGGAA